MRLLLAIALLFLTSSASRATTYYLSATGSDTNSGLIISAPWLTPNHVVNCGDVLLAAPGSYAPMNATFGYVNCTTDNVAWLKCMTFDTCKIIVPPKPDPVAYNYSTPGMGINNSYWGVTGWEISNPTTASDTQACINAAQGIHHILIINNVINICGGAGIGVSVDYAAVVGNAVYGTGTSNTDCASGIGFYRPIQTDTRPGTHIYVAQNFVWNSINPGQNICYDGNGIISDTLDHFNSDCTPYTGGVLVENNITISNGGVGIRMEYNGPEDFPNATCSGAVPSTFSTQVVRNNTAWGNSIGTYAVGSRTGGEFQIQKATSITYTNNLAMDPDQYLFGSSGPVDDGKQPLSPYSAAFQCAACDNGDSVYGNWIYSSYNAPQITANDGTTPYATSFNYASNTTSIDPVFASPQTPPAPNCSGSSGVLQCMATVTANFTPIASGAHAYGYQAPSPTPIPDPLYPDWLSHVTGLPQGFLPPPRRTQVDSGNSVF